MALVIFRDVLALPDCAPGSKFRPWSGGQRTGATKCGPVRAESLLGDWRGILPVPLRGDPRRRGVTLFKRRVLFDRLLFFLPSSRIRA